MVDNKNNTGNKNSGYVHLWKYIYMRLPSNPHEYTYMCIYAFIKCGMYTLPTVECKSMCTCKSMYIYIMYMCMCCYTEENYESFGRRKFTAKKDH